jgi:hypothetical protein
MPGVPLNAREHASSFEPLLQHTEQGEELFIDGDLELLTRAGVVAGALDELSSTATTTEVHNKVANTHTTIINNEAGCLLVFLRNNNDNDVPAPLAIAVDGDRARQLCVIVIIICMAALHLLCVLLLWTNNN